jgi:hypothetical protein
MFQRRWKLLHDGIKQTYDDIIGIILSAPKTSVCPLKEHMVFRCRSVENVMGEACSVHTRDENCVQNVGRKT